MSSYHYSFYSPTDFTAWVFSHRFHCLLRIFSHRFHRFTQNFLLRMFSHRFHRFTQKLGCLQGGALVSARLCRLPEQEVHQPRSAPTKQNRYSPTESTEPTELLAECILPQIAQIDTELLAECILPQISQIYTEVRLRKIVAEVSLPPQLQSDFHRWHRCNFRGCTSCSVGALETSAPP